MAQCPSQQPSMIPLHQPPETPVSLSSFTRISSSADVVAVLSSHAASSRSSSAATMNGFSLARLLGKSKASTSKGGSSIYLHHHHYHHDRSLQKTPSLTPSTRSSSHNYFWDLASSGKERTKDGFPVITLTSPTNSELSIPLPSQDDSMAISVHGTDLHYESSSSKAPCSSASVFPQCIITLDSSSDTLASSSSSPPISLQVPPHLTEQPSPSMSAKGLPYPYIPQQSVPQHMLLHPSFAYNRGSRSEKQTVPPSQTSVPTDFPPTYEEAIDGAGPSSMASSHSGPSTSGQGSRESGSSVSLEVPSFTLSGSTTGTPQVDPSLDASSPSLRRANAPHYNDATTWTECSVDQVGWDPDSEMNPDADHDPLASLSLRPTVSIQLEAGTDG
ncbi:MAG: hypothetical protein J3Q66DRAFT_322081 [Benniella sp.]|nr:MAG: hypothetical protein J3Q66DRAFT_322081 [Benniella sp.]